jgi:predicted HTH transcriptional regulator
LENFFSKPIDQIDANDIFSLKDTPEGQLFEIKSELAAEKNSKDPWYNAPVPSKPRKGPGDYAKQNIFKEIIAFANSEGGWLVLGLTETLDHPKI